MDKRKILKIISRISYFSGFTALSYFLNRDRKRIIAYHNIIPDRYFDNKMHLSHSLKESSFRKQIEIIKTLFRIDTDLDNQTGLSITFDDGYYNQYEIGCKILDENNLKGLFFFTGNLIEENKPFPLDRIEYWFSYVPPIQYKEINITNEESRYKEKEKIKNKYSYEKIIEMLDNLYPFEKIDCMEKEYYKLRFSSVSVSQIEKMKKNGHIVGAHSYYHERLSQLDKNALEEDIEKCSKMKEKIYNSHYFCYPFGSREDISEEVIAILKQKKFTKGLAYTNSSHQNYDQYFIPRIFIPDTSDKYVIEFILSGAKHFLTFRKRLPRY